MIKKHSILSLIFGILISVFVYAGDGTDTIKYSLNMRSSLGFGDYSPFLSTANQYDRHSIYPNNLSLWGTLHKPLTHSKSFDYGFGTELDANISTAEKRFFPGELYAEGKVWLMIFTAGMKRERYGNNDPLLSSGGMIWSRNSRPFPRLSIESDGWLKVPYTFGFLEVNGGLTHGWFTDSTVTTNTLLHYKYAGVRIGGRLPVRINYTLHHVAQWGGTSPRYGTSPGTFGNFKRVFFGQSGDENADEDERINTLGNHIVSKNYGLEFTIKNVELDLYWQNIFEDKPITRIGKAVNLEDGLWGISLKMPKFEPLSRIVVEYLSTTDMSGPWHDLDGVIYGGQDAYYNNGFYTNGWTFYGMTIGNPWLTSPRYNEGGEEEIRNNRLRLYYAAGMGKIDKISYKTTIAYSKNYGSEGVIFDKCKNQFSWQLEANAPAPFWKNTTFSLGLSGDNGSLYGNNFAFLLGLSWNGFFAY